MSCSRDEPSALAEAERAPSRPPHEGGGEEAPARGQDRAPPPGRHPGECRDPALEPMSPNAGLSGPSKGRPGRYGVMDLRTGSRLSPG